ncbi:hypothetical protein [Streptomyces sp. SID8499]|uniref:hypothetical protein n=1 Tax=Streptomyces sp. SID8499 TaxID=2706106 RepID=UPI0013C8BD2E|nr:hypothetical protein [Streptomyces sp. SID8499]NED36706.1 hypothetical protein [Streptomyces sp. SID8499]
MKLSEFIADAQKVLAEHGDLEVLMVDPGCGCCGGDLQWAGFDVTRNKVTAYVDDAYREVDGAVIIC